MVIHPACNYITWSNFLCPFWFRPFARKMTPRMDIKTRRYSLTRFSPLPPPPRLSVGRTTDLNDSSQHLLTSALMSPLRCLLIVIQHCGLSLPPINYKPITLHQLLFHSWKFDSILPIVLFKPTPPPSTSLFLSASAFRFSEPSTAVLE